MVIYPSLGNNGYFFIAIILISICEQCQCITSSNLAQISLNAAKMASVVPVTVTTRSGQEPSLMLIFAPDCRGTQTLVSDNARNVQTKMPL